MEDWQQLTHFINSKHKSMTIDMQGIHDFLVYLTRLSEFKQKENYIPFLTFYKIKFTDSIENSLSSYFKEELTIEKKKIEFNQISNELTNFIRYIDNSDTLIGEYSGSEVFTSIKEEWESLTDTLVDLDWYLVNSDFMISFSVSGKVFVAKVNEDLVVFDFGFSD